MLKWPPPMSPLRSLRVVFALGTAFLLVQASAAPVYRAQAGDIVFHTSTSTQSLAVQKATGSAYSHMGIVLFKQGQPYVFEAIQPVSWTPLQRWLKRGQGGHYVVKRSRIPLTEAQLARLSQEAQKYVGKDYDLTFEWSDQRLYCSELVWKLFKAATGRELAPLARLREFNLNDPTVKAKLAERYGNRLPLDEAVIAPVAILNAPSLVTVAQH